MINCAGCNKSYKEVGYPTEADVMEDGTYANGSFVCDSCYIILIQSGLDVGKPEVIQNRIRNHFNKK